MEPYIPPNIKTNEIGEVLTTVGVVASGLIGLSLFGIAGSILAPILVGGAIRGVD
jgi:predicted PurR-regulated permease PerM